MRIALLAVAHQAITVEVHLLPIVVHPAMMDAAHPDGAIHQVPVTVVHQGAHPIAVVHQATAAAGLLLAAATHPVQAVAEHPAMAVAPVQKAHLQIQDQKPEQAPVPRPAAKNNNQSIE